MGEAALPADERVHDSDLRAALDRAISKLPERYRRVINLRSDHGLSYAEIAEVLGIPARTVETQVTRAIKALREQLRAFIR
jgi:RNA polymerase sigma-70 factor (ECF subfamily)